MLSDTQEKNAGLVGAFIYISEQKKVAKKLSDSEGFLTILFEGANDGILVADMETKKFVMCNGSFSKMTGYSRKETLKLGVNDLLIP